MAISTRSQGKGREGREKSKRDTKGREEKKRKKTRENGEEKANGCYQGSLLMIEEYSLNNECTLRCSAKRCRSANSLIASSPPAAPASPSMPPPPPPRRSRIPAIAAGSSDWRCCAW